MIGLMRMVEMIRTLRIGIMRMISMERTKRIMTIAMTGMVRVISPIRKIIRTMTMMSTTGCH